MPDDKLQVGFAQRLQQLIPSLMYLYRVESPHWEGAVVVTDIRLKFPDVAAGETLIVIRGLTRENEAVVAFHSDVGVVEALAGALRRLGTGKMKWRDDEYA